MQFFKNFPGKDVGGVVDRRVAAPYNNHKKPKMEAYSILWNLLHADHTREYLDRFKNCFAVFVDKMRVPFYISDDEEEENP